MIRGYMVEEFYPLKEEPIMKNWYTSKTIWFGIFQVLFGVIGLITGNMDATQATTLIITGLGTIGLRANTSTGIE